MNVMTRRQQDLLDQFIRVAGSSDIVLTALRELTVEGAGSPSVRSVIKRIAQIRARRGIETQTGSAVTGVES